MKKNCVTFAMKLFPRGAKQATSYMKKACKAEIKPVEPEQGNSCEGKATSLYVFIFL